MASKYSIEPTIAGFKVILAPGLTSPLKNPCLACTYRFADKDMCGEVCPNHKQAARDKYVGTIGYDITPSAEIGGVV